MRHSLRRLLVPACLLAAAPAVGQAPSAAPAAPWSEPAGWGAAIDSFAARLAADVARDGVGGITAAVFVGPTVVWARGFGMADPEHGVPAGVATIYRVGSISKSVTALLLADMVEAGEVALDEPVAEVLPDLAALRDAPAEAAAITWRQLAAHTAGLVREPALPGAARGAFALWEGKVLASIPTTALTRRPGEAYGYSNIGYGILGLALSRRAGLPFTDLVRERIVAPLGAADMAFALGPHQLPRLAVGHSNGNGEVDRSTPARELAARSAPSSPSATRSSRSSASRAPSRPSSNPCGHISSSG